MSERLLAAVTAVEAAAGPVCRGQLIWSRSKGHFCNNMLLPLGIYVFVLQCVFLCCMLESVHMELYTFFSSPAYSYSYPISQSWCNSAVNEIVHIQVRYRLHLVFPSKLRTEEKNKWSQWFWPWYDCWCRMSWFDRSWLWHSSSPEIFMHKRFNSEWCEKQHQQQQKNIRWAEVVQKKTVDEEAQREMCGRS